MKIYIHRSPGHYLGCIAIVIASSKRKASAIIRKRLDESGLSHEAINIDEMRNIEPGIIHFWDGDY